MRVLASLDTFRIQNDGLLPPSTTGGVGTRQGLTGRLYSEFRLEVGFFREGSNDSLLDLGSDIEMEWILKRSTGTQKYDAVVIAEAVEFTRSAEGDDFIYSGTMDLGAPNFEKLLGVDWKAQAEIVTIETVADVGGSLSGTYFDIFYGDGAAEFHRFWMGVIPPTGGGTLVEVVAYAADASATTLATAIHDAIVAGGSYGWTPSHDGNTVTLERTTRELHGFHDPKTSTFTITTVQAGMAGDAEADVESVTLLAELSFELDGERQILELFNFVVQNTLRRPGAGGPGPTPPSNVRGVPAGTVAQWAGLAAPAGWALCYGQAVARATYPTLFGNLSLSQDGARTNASAVITGLSDTSAMREGMPVSGTGIPSSTTILTVDSGTQITLSANATSTGTGTVVVAPFGVGDGSTTFNLPDLRGRVAAGRDDMGGSAANRLTVGSASEMEGNRLGASGGDEEHALSAEETGTFELAAGTSIDTGGAAYGVESASIGDADPHNNVQPTVVVNFIIRLT